MSGAFITFNLGLALFRWFWKVIKGVRYFQKCPNTEFYPKWENTDQKKLRIWTLFTQCFVINHLENTLFLTFLKYKKTFCCVPRSAFI